MEHEDAAQIGVWTLTTEAISGGARIRLVSHTHGIEAVIDLDRQDARAFAHGTLAAAGDATFRTIPHPSAEA